MGAGNSSYKPYSQILVLLLVKRNKGPLVKHAFHLKPTLKWVRKAWVREAHLTGFDLAMDTS